MRAATGKVIGGKVVEGSTVAAFAPKPDGEMEHNRLAAIRLAQVVREAIEGDFLEEDADQFLKHLDRRFGETASA